MNFKHHLSLAAAATILLPATHLFAQMTGVSNPNPDDNTYVPTTSDSAHYTKPSPGQPAASSSLSVRTHTDEPIVYGAYKPYVPASPAAPKPAAAPAGVPNPETNAYGPYRPYVPTIVANDDNSGIVTIAPAGPNALPMGTELKANLQQTISTITTHTGARFSAELSEDVTRNGITLLPAGTLIHGRITRVQGGRRIGGPSVIRLQPDNLSLPDGTTYKFDAQVTNLVHARTSHVNSEGTIVANPHTTQNVLSFGLTTSAAGVTGGMIGGATGALIGLGVGAGAATVYWLKHERQIEVPSGTGITFTLSDPLQLNPAH